MGFAIAAAAAEQGHRVTLISGPVSEATPAGVERVDVVTAAEMLNAKGQLKVKLNRKVVSRGKIELDSSPASSEFLLSAFAATGERSVGYVASLSFDVVRAMR